MAKTEFKYVTVIAAPAATVWRMLISSEFTRQYWHGVDGPEILEEGSDYCYRKPDGGVGAEGKVIESTPYTKLVYTWHFPSGPETAAEPPSRVTYELEEREGNTILTLTHDQLDAAPVTAAMVIHGWPFVLSGLKTLAEVGKTTDYTKFS